MLKAFLLNMEEKKGAEFNETSPRWWERNGLIMLLVFVATDGIGNKSMLEWRMDPIK